MTRLIKDSSLFAVYDPDTGRENLYQYSGAQLFEDVSFTIENELNDYLSVTNVEQNLAFPGGRLDLVGNEFIYTPAYQHIYGTDDIILVGNYTDYLGVQQLEGGVDKQYNWNQYFSTEINVNTLFRKAQEVTSWENGITYDDADQPKYIVSVEADSFVTLNHDVTLLLDGPTPNRPRSEASTVDDLTTVREYQDAKIAEINSNVQNIATFIRQTENIEEGGLYHLVKATGADTEPGRSQFDPDEPTAIAPEVVFFFPGADQKWSDTTKVRIHQNFIRNFDDNDDPVEGTYNYKRFITGGYITFESSTDVYSVYSITGHISDGGDPDGSEGQQIGSSDEDYFEFEVDLVSGPAGDMLEIENLYRVNLYSLETGINIEQADSRYVNVTGDIVTGTIAFTTDATPISVADAAGDNHLTIAANGVITQPDLHDNAVDHHMVNRKNLSDAIAEESAIIDTKYVKKTGDIMSGTLRLELPTPDSNSNSFTIKGRVLNNGSLQEGILFKDYRREKNNTTADYCAYYGSISSDESIVHKKYVDDKVASAATDLGTTTTGTTVTITSSTGDSTDIEAASKTDAGVVTNTTQEFWGHKTLERITVGDQGNYGIVLKSKFSANGSVGTPGYVLTSQGDIGPAIWTPSNAEPGVPVGLIAFWGHKAPVPVGWLVLDGSSYDINQFANLHSLLSQTSGYVSGKLPDYRDRFVCAIGGAGGVNTGDAGQALTEMTKAPATAFLMNTSTHTHTITASEGTNGHGHTATSATAGSHAHKMGDAANVSGKDSGGRFYPSHTGTSTTGTAGSHSHTITVTNTKVTVTGTATGGSHSHTMKTSDGGDATTRPKTVLGYWIIQA